MMDELVKRLREQAETERYYYGEDMLYDEAADAIEELSKRVDESSTLQNKGGKIK